VAVPPPPGRDGSKRFLDSLKRIPGLSAIANLPENTRITVEQWLASGYGGALKYFGKPFLYMLGTLVPGIGLLAWGFKTGSKDAIVVGNQLASKIIDPSPREIEEIIENLREVAGALSKLDAEGLKRALLRPRSEVEAPIQRLRETFGSLRLPRFTAPPQKPSGGSSPPPAPKRTRRFR